jgi:shikimate dehydrogenase
MSKYALLGRGIDYSFSPSFFKEKFEKLNFTNHEYSLLDLPNLEDLKSIINQKELSGFNVTQPYKEEIIPFLDQLDPVAEKIGAVNCVKITKEGKWIGYNADEFGFRQMIKPFLEPIHSKALILGTGGASKAVEYVLESLGMDVFYVSRNPKTNKQLTYEALQKEHINFFQLIVNTTPLGTFPQTEELPNIPYQFLGNSHFLIDLIYNPPKTGFLKKGEEQGSMILNGKDMLVWQAEKSWEIWKD